MLDELKKRVCEANRRLAADQLVTQTWGNASAIDRHRGWVVIKPSGLAYAALKPDDMVVVSLHGGRVIDGRLKPSSDIPAHLVLYEAFKEIGGVVHTYSFFATAWAQACRAIPVFGTSHADFFSAPIPCTRRLTSREIEKHYEANTARAILECFTKLDPLACPAVLVANHGPYAWGRTVEEAIRHGAVLEQLARLASETLRIDPRSEPLQNALLKKHFFRKFGPKASYGQRIAVGSGSELAPEFLIHPPQRLSRD
jgi:L-ribulose-5-phosphate 4-epimerase